MHLEGQDDQQSRHSGGSRLCRGRGRRGGTEERGGGQSSYSGSEGRLDEQLEKTANGRLGTDYK